LGCNTRATFPEQAAKHRHFGTGAADWLQVEGNINAAAASKPSRGQLPSTLSDSAGIRHFDGTRLAWRSIMRIDRLDTKLDTAVNKALAVALLGDVHTGVRIMVNAGVPPKVAARVIFSPHHRRASDWKR
jgi:hypothetical protein